MFPQVERINHILPGENKFSRVVDANTGRAEVAEWVVRGWKEFKGNARKALPFEMRKQH